MTTSKADTLAAQCKMGGLAAGVREYKFHPTRKWAFDLAWPELHVAVEVEGGIWISGRHNRPAGWIKDAEKYNEAAILGWRILHVMPDQVDDWTAFGLVERVVRG